MSSPGHLNLRTAGLLLIPPILWAGNAVVGRLVHESVPPITLNFLQPLAHAAAMSDGGPGSVWSVLCNASVADTDSVDKADTAPVPAAVKHECCLGLAQAASVIAPSAAYVALPPVTTALAPSLPVARGLAAAIRDGPTRPRGPPSLG